ncbi:ABC transporter ATP-binding protein [Paracoccus aestuariivivens]|uniref:ATP-binding cassette domain-containing protein n=1 Tax=Paracoccus aestuariivivens TaxID=1820333 RepID=A0A6L6JA29_9RHOB|nr:ABC transporter ATP-binding protein [Paracoccus aestuariivivens]MTH77968.1 ATP-binding cassette domain-containing protein [Paracoccus aestuariivivens]
MTNNLLRVRDLCIDAPASKGPIRIAQGIDFDLHRGEVLALIGESGAGKSTIGIATLGAGRGGAYIAQGSILLEGEDIMAKGAARLRSIRGLRVAYVAQSAASAFNPAHRLIDQVTETIISRGIMDRPAARSRAIELFRKLGLPSPETFGEKFPHQASGGQLQRAMTAMAICAGPELIVFDEPTTALDVTTQIEVLLSIRQAIRDEGMAAIYISHDLALVAQIADQIMVLRHGQIVETGPTRDIIERPQQDYTRRLIAVQSVALPTRSSQPVMLEISGINASYGRVPVLHNINLSVAKGRTLALVGESGSGKSTLGKVVAGLLPPDSGRVTLVDRPLSSSLSGRSRQDLRDIQLVHQNPDLALNPRRSVGDSIGQAVTMFRGLTNKDCSREVAHLLEQVNLDPALATRLPHALSGGQKQRVCIARALAANPRLIICDEVTSALDPLVAEGVQNLLRQLQEDEGVSYLFITHDFGAVRAMADEVAVMRQGSVIAYGPTGQVLNAPQDPYTQKLISSVPELRVGWLDDIVAARTAPQNARTEKMT